MQSNRGFHFLIGIAVVWLFWRLLITGVLHDIGFLALSQEQAFRGPGAILIAFFIEAIIAIGAVAVLVVTGLWQAIYQAGVLVQDAFRMLVDYLSEWQAAKPDAGDEVPVADIKPSEPKPVNADAANPLIGAIIDTREQMQAQQVLIERLTAKIDSLQPATAPEGTE